MAATRRVDTEEYIAATAAARGVREQVAEQLHKLVVERDEMSGRSGFTDAVERILFCERRLAEARGRVHQARIEGLPVARPSSDVEEFKGLLREAVMGAAVACGGWVASMDYELVRQEQATDAA